MNFLVNVILILKSSEMKRKISTGVVIVLVEVILLFFAVASFAETIYFKDKRYWHREKIEAEIIEENKQEIIMRYIPENSRLKTQWSRIAKRDIEKIVNEKGEILYKSPEAISFKIDPIALKYIVAFLFPLMPLIGLSCIIITFFIPSMMLLNNYFRKKNIKRKHPLALWSAIIAINIISFWLIYMRAETYSKIAEAISNGYEVKGSGWVLLMLYAYSAIFVFLPSLSLVIRIAIHILTKNINKKVGVIELLLCVLPFLLILNPNPHFNNILNQGINYTQNQFNRF